MSDLKTRLFLKDTVTLLIHAQTDCRAVKQEDKWVRVLRWAWLTGELNPQFTMHLYIMFTQTHTHFLCVAALMDPMHCTRVGSLAGWNRGKSNHWRDRFEQKSYKIENYSTNALELPHCCRHRIRSDARKQGKDPTQCQSTLLNKKKGFTRQTKAETASSCCVEIGDGKSAMLSDPAVAPQEFPYLSETKDPGKQKKITFLLWNL